MRGRFILVTGGTGFIGAAAVRHLLAAGYRVRVVDNNTRGRARRLEGIVGEIEIVEADVRDGVAVDRAIMGVDAVLHLAYINGTEFFYSHPDLVLDVGIRGMLNVLDACKRHGVREFFLASSSEVYQTPPIIPTPEDVPMVVPDSSNPRYSYGGGKIACELLALHVGGRQFERVAIFRPHNVYGPDMGWEHVLPQFALRMVGLAAANPKGPIRFPLQGTGEETRAFNWIGDFAEGLMTVIEKGRHLETYNIGTPEEVSVADAAHAVASCFEREIEIVPEPAAKGGTSRRCPDISKLAALGYAPRVPVRDGVPKLVEWYRANAHLAPEAGKV